MACVNYFYPHWLFCVSTSCKIKRWVRKIEPGKLSRQRLNGSVSQLQIHAQEGEAAGLRLKAMNTRRFCLLCSCIVWHITTDIYISFYEANDSKQQSCGLWHTRGPCAAPVYKRVTRIPTTLGQGGEATLKPRARRVFFFPPAIKRDAVLTLNKGRKRVIETAGNRRDCIWSQLQLSWLHLPPLTSPSVKKTPWRRRFCCPSSQRAANAGTKNPNNPKAKKQKQNTHKNPGQWQGCRACGFMRMHRSDPRRRLAPGLHGPARLLASQGKLGGAEGRTRELRAPSPASRSAHPPGPANSAALYGTRGLKGTRKPRPPPPFCCFLRSLPAAHVARRCGSQGTAPTSGHTGSSRPRPADARLPPGGLPRPAAPGRARPRRHFLPCRPHVRARSQSRASRGASGRGSGCAGSRAPTWRLGLTGVTCILARSLNSKRHSCMEGFRYAVLGVWGLWSRSPRLSVQMWLPSTRGSPGWGRWLACLGGSPPSQLPQFLSRFISWACARTEAVHLLHLP